MHARPAPLPRCAPWLATGVLLAALRLGSAEEPAPPQPVPPLPATATAATAIDVDRLVGEALAGDAGALQTMRTTAPGLEDAQAMAILERVRASGTNRGSAVAACFVLHREAWVQRTAISAIARLGLDRVETLDLLVKGIGSPSPIVGQASAIALSDLRDARSWSPLIDLLAASDAEHVRMAHESLQRQTNQTWPAEQAPWREWLAGRLADETAQFDHFRQQLTAGMPGAALAAIDGLASLELLRDQATTILLTLLDSPEQTVRDRVEKHLRQWTGTKGGEPLSIALERAHERASAPPPPASAASTSPAVAPVAAPLTVSSPGFFETTYGMVLIVTVCSGALALLLWFLRTPAGQLVQNATGRFTKSIGRSRVVVMVSNGTKRFARAMPGPIRGMTKRIAKPAKAAAERLAGETRRMLKPPGRPGP